MSTPTFDDTTEPQTMRARALTALADATLTAHTARSTTDGISVSPAKVLVGVLFQADTFWTAATADRPCTVDDYREIATEMHRRGIERIPAAVDGFIRSARRLRPVTEVPSTFDDTDWSRYLLGAVSSGEAVRGAVVRNHDQVQRLRDQLAAAHARVADLEAQLRDQNDVLREQATDLRHAEQDAYIAWCRDN